jgi:hypothetical protein
MSVLIPPPPLARTAVALAVPPPPQDWPVDHVAFCDTECYPNYWLLKLRPLGGTVITYRLHAWQTFSPEQVERLMALLDHFCVITFNGLGYDRWTIARALAFGTPADMKVVNDLLIVKDPVTKKSKRGWELGLGNWEPRNHIDVMEVCPGAGGQKAYAGRIHAKTMRDLPFDPGLPLTAAQIEQLDAYCENDLDVLEHIWRECKPLLKIRERLSARYGLNLMSKSDAQLAEAVLKKRCEDALGHKIWKPEMTDMRPLRYRVPEFISYSTPELQHVLNVVRDSVFYLGFSGEIVMPEPMTKLEIRIGSASYKIGVGGLHSQEKSISYRATDDLLLRDIDVESYYPSLIINSGEYPPALGPQFQVEYVAIKTERVGAKALQKQLEKAEQTGTPQWEDARSENEGGKVGINGTFGKTGNVYSILFAPQMLLQTTVTGQLSLLMLIEWHEAYGIPIISANTDGIVMACPAHLLDVSKHLVTEWERRTDLKMEETYYRSMHSHNVNNYFAVKTDGKVKRKGEYAQASFIDKKSPDVEVCHDAIARFLSEGYPFDLHVMQERDIRKFVTVQKVDGGGFKMWGEAPLGDEKTADMLPRLAAHGWIQQKRGRWTHHAHRNPEYHSTRDAFALTFKPQMPEYLGKNVRWYYGTKSPGAIVYVTRNAKVSLSYGAQPCMTLPDEFPADIDYAWYMRKCRSILSDVGYRP